MWCPMVGDALQRFAIVLMLFAGFAQIIDLLTLIAGGNQGGLEIALIYAALIISFIGMLIELATE